MAEPKTAAPLGAIARIKGAAFTYSTLLRDFFARSPFTVGLFVVVELAQVAFQSAIGLFVLLFLRKVGGDSILQLGPQSADGEVEAPAAAVAPSGLLERLNGFAQSPQALIDTLSEQLSLPSLLAIFLAVMVAAALSTFAASYLLNRRARQYEDFAVKRALTRLSNIGFNELAQIRRWMPVDRASALKLIQTDARMTAISARLLVYGLAALGLMSVVLVVLAVVDWRVAGVAVALLGVSTAPLLVLMVFGSRHSDDMLDRAPAIAKEKQRLLDVALARPQRLDADDATLNDAFAKGGAISNFMDTFETRFQLLSISSFVFTLVTNLVLVAIGFFMLIEVLSGRLEATLLVLFFVVLSLLVRAFRQVANFMTSVSRLHRPTETHQRFIAATHDRAFDNRTAVVTHQKTTALPLNVDVKGLQDGAQLEPGRVYAVLTREPTSRFWAYEFHDLAITNSHKHADMLNRTVILNEVVDRSELSVRELVGAQRGFFAEDYASLQAEIAEIWAADPSVEALQERDWPATLDTKIGHHLVKPGLAGLVRVLGAARFSGAIIFLHASLLNGVTARQRDALFAALGASITVFFDRRPRPELFEMRRHLTKVFIKTPGIVSAVAPSQLTLPPRELMDKMVAQEAERPVTDADPALYDAV